MHYLRLHYQEFHECYTQDFAIYHFQEIINCLWSLYLWTDYMQTFITPMWWSNLWWVDIRHSCAVSHCIIAECSKVYCDPILFLTLYVHIHIYIYIYVYIASFPGFPRAQMKNRFSVLKATESWTGPGNKANVYIHVGLFVPGGFSCYVSTLSKHVCLAWGSHSLNCLLG